MKVLKVILILSLLIIILFIDLKRNDIFLQTGCISFISINSTNNDNDGFEIIANVNIPPKTKIRFTDSEWNGNHFGFDENDITWLTGNRIIKAQSVISFTNLNSNASVSVGTLSGSMRLSKKEDAIFAYLGDKRMPTIFLAAITNNEQGYGTLINTGLINGKTAIIFQEEK